MKRDPSLHWWLTALTLGQYGFLWGFRLAHDANELAGGSALDVKKHARVFRIGYTVYIVSGIILVAAASWLDADPTPLGDSVFWYLYALAMGLTGYFLWILVRVAQILRSVSGSNIPWSGTVVLLFFLGAISLPMLQDHLNKQIEKKPNQAPQTTPGSSAPRSCLS